MYYHSSALFIVPLRVTWYHNLLVHSFAHVPSDMSCSETPPYLEFIQNSPRSTTATLQRYGYPRITLSSPPRLLPAAASLSAIGSSFLEF
jgi:hypothetical protein